MKPDPITTQSQSPWGASEGEERFSTATAAAYYMLLQFSFPTAGGGKGKLKDVFSDFNQLVNTNIKVFPKANLIANPNADLKANPKANPNAPEPVMEPATKRVTQPILKQVTEPPLELTKSKSQSESQSRSQSRFYSQY